MGGLQDCTTVETRASAGSTFEASAFIVFFFSIHCFLKHFNLVGLIIHGYKQTLKPRPFAVCRLAVFSKNPYLQIVWVREVELIIRVDGKTVRLHFHYHKLLKPERFEDLRLRRSTVRQSCKHKCKTSEACKLKGLKGLCSRQSCRFQC